MNMHITSWPPSFENTPIITHGLYLYKGVTSRDIIDPQRNGMVFIWDKGHPR